MQRAACVYGQFGRSYYNRKSPCLVGGIIAFAPRLLAVYFRKGGVHIHVCVCLVFFRALCAPEK